jgi:hypothetical protein
MSSRYDSPAAAGKRPEPTTAGSADSASIWEALTRGDDPTSAAERRVAG